MDIALRDVRAHPADQVWISGVLPLYLRDLESGGADSTVSAQTGVPAPLAQEALRDWLRNRHSQVLCITCDLQPVGFVVMTPASAAQPGHYCLSDFFISRERRRLGVGRRAASLVLDRFAGRWEVRQPSRNARAVGFWRDVIRRYTAGRYEERLANGEVCQRFETPKRPPAH